MARPLAVVAAIAVSLLLVSGAGGAGAQTPKRGGMLVIQRGIGTEPACFNPLLEKCFGAPWVFDVLEGAFDQGLFTARPNLVSSVEYTTRPPFLLTYHIRPEAQWSDGVPVTARDFIFTRNAILRYTPGQIDVAERKFIRSVRALDAKTLQVVLRSRLGSWRGLFWFVMPYHALRGEDLTKVWIDGMDNPKTGKPIGSGPFLVESIERGKRLTLVRNPRYRSPRSAYLDRLVVRLDLFGVPSIEDALRRGELDLIQAPILPEDVERLRAIPGIRVEVGQTVLREHLVVRVGAGGHPALKQKLVRRAIAFAIDRARHERAINGALLPSIRPLQNMIFPLRSPYYEPHWHRYRSRPQEARRLLEQAGCRVGADGIRACAGERLTLRLVTSPAAARVLRTSLIQEDLRRVGIEVRPSFAPSAVFLNQILESGEFDVAFLSWNFQDPVGLGQIFGCGGSSNFYGYCQRLVTRDLDQADRILDPAQRARVLNRADAQMARDVPLVPFGQPPITAAVRSSLHGFSMSFPIVLWNSEEWWLER